MIWASPDLRISKLLKLAVLLLTQTRTKRALLALVLSHSSRRGVKGVLHPFVGRKRQRRRERESQKV